jgi:hypothetical protein
MARKKSCWGFIISWTFWGCFSMKTIKWSTDINPPPLKSVKGLSYWNPNICHFLSSIVIYPVNYFDFVISVDKLPSDTLIFFSTSTSYLMSSSEFIFQLFYCQSSFFRPITFSLQSMLFLFISFLAYVFFRLKCLISFVFKLYFH